MATMIVAVEMLQPNRSLNKCSGAPDELLSKNFPVVLAVRDLAV